MAPHVMPVLSLVTLPLPLPGFVTVSVWPLRTVIVCDVELFDGSGSEPNPLLETEAVTSNAPDPGGLTFTSMAALASRGIDGIPQ